MASRKRLKTIIPKQYTMKTLDTDFPGLLHITSIHNDNSPLLEIIYGQNFPPYNPLKEKKATLSNTKISVCFAMESIFPSHIVPVVAICLKAMTCQWNSKFQTIFSAFSHLGLTAYKSSKHFSIYYSIPKHVSLYKISVPKKHNHFRILCNLLL